MLSRSLNLVNRRSWNRLTCFKQSPPGAAGADIASLGSLNSRVPKLQLRKACTKISYDTQAESTTVGKTVPSVLETTPSSSAASVGGDEYTLSDLDIISPNAMVTSFLVYKLQPEHNIQLITESLQRGLDHAADQIPPLNARIHFKSSGKPRKRMTRGLLKLKVRHFNHWEHKSYDELATTSFSPSDFDQGRLLPVEAYDNMDMRPVLLAQLSFIDGGLILALGLNHVASDGGARNLAITTICKSSRAYMEDAPLVRSRLNYERSNFSAPEELLELPKEKLAMRVKDYRIIETTALADSASRPHMGSNLAKVNKALIYRVQGSSVQKFKDSRRPSNGGEYLSTYDCFTAMLWRSLMRVRTLLKPHLLDGKSRLLHPVDLRNRVGPAVSKDYFGNAVTVISAGPVSMADLLGPNGLSLAASSIRQSILSTSLAAIADATALGNMTAPTERLVFLPGRGLLDEDFMLSTWHFMNTAAYDFGIGPPTSIRCPAVAAPGFAFLFPDCERRKDGRVHDMYVTLPAAEQDLLSKDEEFRNWFRIL